MSTTELSPEELIEQLERASEHNLSQAHRLNLTIESAREERNWFRGQAKAQKALVKRLKAQLKA